MTTASESNLPPTIGEALGDVINMRVPELGGSMIRKWVQLDCDGSWLRIRISRKRKNGAAESDDE